MRAGPPRGPSNHVQLPVALATALGMLAGCSSVANFVADKVLSNVTIPSDPEYPPTAVAIPPSSDTATEIGGKGMGLSCSIPDVANSAFPRAGTEAAVSLQMRQGCIFHDYCYRHGQATYGYSQADCDYMLQEHAARLCKQIYSSDSRQCQLDAKKVLLGVWLGGASSFHRSDASTPESLSTHFEFDPLPIKTQRYTVARIAGPPADPIESCGARRTLYYFEVRPSGTKVSQVTWGAHGRATCLPTVRRTALPGDPRFRNVAPSVVKDARGEDWFVWWRRAETSNTVTQVLVLSPSRLDIDLWSPHFFESTAVDRPGEVFRIPVDPLINYGHFVPAGKDDALVFGGLSSQGGCHPTGSAGLSWQQLVIDTSTGANALACMPALSGDLLLTDYYRHITVPPLLVEATSEGPGDLIWQSRGTGHGGRDYQESTTFLVAPLPAIDVDVDGGALHAHAHAAPVTERLEPVAVVRAHGDPTPRLLSLSVEDDVVAREGRIRADRMNAPIELEIVPITPPLDAGWMSRPPVVLKSNGTSGTPILFSRFFPARDVAPPAIAFAMAERGEDGWRTYARTVCRFPLQGTAESSDLCTSGKAAASARAALASGQMIIGDIVDDATPDVVITNDRDPAATIILVGEQIEGIYRVRVNDRYVCPGWIVCEEDR